MKTAAQVLGIVGGALSLLGGGCAAVTLVLIIPGIIKVVSGILGLVGGCITNSNTLAGGILMTIAGALGLFFGMSFIAGPILLIGGILAIVAANTAKNSTGSQSQAQPPM